MKNELISKLEFLISEYENECNKYSSKSESISEYYGGKADGLKEALELILDIE